MNFYYNPVRLYWDSHCIKNLKENIKELNAGKILLIKWSETALQNEAGKELQEALSDCEVTELIFEKSNPDIHDLYKLYQNKRQNKPELIIAVGGGSVLDIAKSLAAVLDKEYATVEELREAIMQKNTGRPYCPWVGIPTTAGTGSEVTCWATIWDGEKGSKLSLEDKRNYAYAAFIEPEFTMSMPMKLVVSSALDAVAHATESYWAKAHNLVSGIYALKAISMIMTNLEKLMENPKKEYYLAMAEASMFAGRAFSNTKTTACHSISYPLTLHYGIPHGVAVSMLLPALLCINESKIQQKELLLDAYGAGTMEEAGQRIIHLLDKAGISYKLSDWKVKREELDGIAANCFTKGRMENNPVDLSKEDVIMILEKIW
ncbi:MAG: phosphonoacetaldehyde reductase [Lachnospiraceae bacterium]|nr:phosphonoacetaldehyde reductase [Lachnospiraceae bacterium]